MLLKKKDSKKYKYVTCLIILSLFLVASNVFSQNYIYVGTKSYNATSVWNFSPFKRTFSDDNISVQIGKSSIGGMLMLTVSSEFGKASINGTILIYLKNGKVIQLLKKIVSDYANDKISVIYSINSNDLTEMKKSNIRDIRFTYFSNFNQKMGLNARNGQIYNNGIKEIQMTEIETAIEIEEICRQ
jgi:hypothetical protein